MKDLDENATEEKKTPAKKKDLAEVAKMLEEEDQSAEKPAKASVEKPAEKAEEAPAEAPVEKKPAKKASKSEA
jgi:hypothetical protein